jgi:phenylpropionate dioxygenase-like ring-hydroxylating dioxygenase large terminal subunit
MPRRSIPAPRGETDLVALPAEERHGLLWVVPTPQDAGASIDVAAWLGPLDAEMPFLDVASLVHFRTVRTEVEANWKLMVDAFLEAYHIRVLHQETIWPFFADGVTATERVGPHIQSLVARRAAAEWAAGGGRIEDVRDLAGLCRLATPTNVIFPNAIHIFHPDYLSVITLHPVAAGRLRWIHRMLVPKSKTTPDWMPHWEKTFRLIEQGVFQKEDIACAVGIQKGFASGANTHLLAGRAEQGVGWFHEAVAERLGGLG